MQKAKYSYKGAVLHFDRVVDASWSGETMAVSEKQAISNLTYQFRKKFNYSETASIRLLEKPIKEAS